MTNVLGIIIIIIGGLITLGSAGGIPELRRSAGKRRRTVLAQVLAAAVIGLIVLAGGITLLGAPS